jgi:hypothetical protein
MAIESGKDGKVFIGTAAVADVTSWEFEKDAHTTRYASSSTGGFKKTVPGVKMGAGAVELKWDSTAASPLAEGSSVTLKLYLNATEFFTVPAVITKFRVKVDIDSGEVTAAHAQFETDGAWTEPSLS